MHHWSTVCLQNNACMRTNVGRFLADLNHAMFWHLDSVTRVRGSSSFYVQIRHWAPKISIAFARSFCRCLGLLLFFGLELSRIMRSNMI
jgi:hypothetical protein